MIYILIALSALAMAVCFKISAKAMLFIFSLTVYVLCVILITHLSNGESLESLNIRYNFWHQFTFFISFLAWLFILDLKPFEKAISNFK